MMEDRIQQAPKRIGAVALVSLIFAFLPYMKASHAQVNTPHRGFQPANAYALSDLETINTTNGNLIYNFPLGQLPNGRGGLSASLNLIYNSKLYETRLEYVLDENEEISPQFLVKKGQAGGWRYGYKYQTRLINRADGGFDCRDSNGTIIPESAYIWKFRMIFPDGSEHEFRPLGFQNHDGFFGVKPDGMINECLGGGQVTTGLSYYSTDGTYIRLQFAPASSTSWTLFLPDGRRVVQQLGQPQRLYDRNNNFVELQEVTNFNNTSHDATVLTDEFGRSVVIEYDTGLNQDTVSFSGVNNEPVTWTVQWRNIIVNKEYRATGPSGEPGRGTSQTLHANLRVVDRIFLPVQAGALSYVFVYNADNGSLTNPSFGWGEISSVTFPSGAQVSYQYWLDGATEFGSLGPASNHVLHNYPKEKTVTYEPEYDGVVNPNPIVETWHYDVSSTSSVTTAPDFGNTVEFHGDTSYPNNRLGLVYKLIRPDGTVIERDWRQNLPLGFDPLVGANPYVKTEFTSVKDANGVLSKTGIKDFNYDKNGNVTAVKEYDWVAYGDVPRDQNDMPTGIPAGAVLKRLTINTYSHPTPDASDNTSSTDDCYWNPTAPSLRKAMASRQISDGVRILSHIEFSYDNPATTGNLTQQKSWDSTKGALPSTPPFLTTENSLSVSYQYDSFGNPILSIDARGFQTQLGYDPINGIANLYPTQIKTAFQTTVQRTETRQYDFHTGLVTRSTDVENGVSNATNYDVFGRPTLVRAAEGMPEETRTSTEYSDANRRVIVRSDLNAVGDGKLVTITHFDRRGRVRLSRQLEDAATQSATDETTGIKVQTRYVYSGSNSYVLTSNPYRAATSALASSEPTMGWAHSKSDDGGRVIEVQTFAGATLPAPWGGNTFSTGGVLTAYDANFTTVTDQAGKQRKSATDGLGRLSEVYEDPNGLNYLTRYAYDALDNLTTVTQDSQQRFFKYDSVKRLIRARNPEQNVRTPGLDLSDPLTGNSQWCMAYQYDNNGNLTQKTDARGVISDYVYDALNRNTTIDYSDTSGVNPDITRVYDTATNGKGRLRESYQGGNETVGTDVEHTKIESYDALGRPLDQRQRFKTIDGWSAEYKTLREYNRAGGVISQTYPSGHTINYNYDNADRINSFTGNLGDGVVRTYATGITYSPFGGKQQEQFGTQTPLFHKLHYNVRGQLNDLRLSTVSWQTDEWNWNRGALLNYYSQTEVACQTNQCRANSGPGNNGNIIQSQHWVPANDQISSYNWTEDRYTYDSLNRITSIAEYHGWLGGFSAQDFTQIYDYDRWGNRTINSATTDGMPETQFTVLPNNRLSVPVGQTGRMDYDAAGNLINDTYTSYGRTDGTPTRLYDAVNRLTTARDANLQVVSSYSYNAEGQRTRRKVSGVETWQMYGFDGELLGEYKSGAAPFLPTREYGYRGGQLLVTMSSGDDARLTRFVYNLYYGALQRDPTSQELQDQVNQLAAVGVQSQSQLLTTAKQIARSLFIATAFETSPYRSDVQYVTDLYYTYLQRGPDSGGLGWWVSQVPGSGRENVLNAFEASSEFATIVSTLYGTATSDNQRTENFVNNFYLAALGRHATPTELQQQRDALNAEAALGVSQVQAQSESFGRSLFEAQINDASISNTQYVTNLYEGFLQRGPDAGGLGWWSGQATLGQGRQNVINAFAACIPFRELSATLYREAFWLVADHLGTPRMIVSKSGGLGGIKRHDYLPFGEEIAANAAGRTPVQGYVQDAVRQKFTSKERDIETGLDYFGARYHSSTQGRFTSVDPAKLKQRHLSNPQDLNRYSYVANNPLAFIDPDGKEKVKIIIRTFIPSKTVSVPWPGIVNKISERTFAGDGRKVSEPGTYRTQQIITIETDRSKNGGCSTCPFISSEAKPGTTREILLNGTEKTGHADVSRISGAAIYTTRDSDHITVTAKGLAADPLVIGAPDLKYDLNIGLGYDMKGNLYADVDGIKSQFPGIEILIQRPETSEKSEQLLTGYNPEDAGRGLFDIYFKEPIEGTKKLKPE